MDLLNIDIALSHKLTTNPDNTIFYNWCDLYGYGNRAGGLFVLRLNFTKLIIKCDDVPFWSKINICVRKFLTDYQEWRRSLFNCLVIINLYMLQLKYQLSLRVH